MAPYHRKPHHNLSTMDNKSCWHPLHHLLWWRRFVLWLIKKVKLLINHKKEIEFTDRGISICGAEEILWNEIADFSLIRFKGNRLITIQMKNPEKVIANEPSWIKRKTMEYNLKTINALYSFPAYMMDGRAEEALTLCKLNLAKHK